MSTKTAIITGASSGIGREFARIHASKGGNLVIVARREDKLNELKKELENKYNVNVKVIVKDLSLDNSAQEIYNEVKNADIKINYLINSAGFGSRIEFSISSMEKDIEMIKVNIISLTRLTKLFLNDFVKQGEGRILNVSSTGAVFPGPLQAVYCATKSYVASFSNAVWYESKGSNITVTNIMPGATNTGFAKTADMNDTPLFIKTASPVKVAEDGYRGMLKGKLNVYSGVPLSQRVLFAIISLIPKNMVLRMVYNMQKK